MDGSLAFYLLILVAVVLGWFLPHSSLNEEGGGPATEPQIDYLWILIRGDSEFAISIGVSLDGVKPISNLSKLKASVAISRLKDRKEQIQNCMSE